MVFIIIMLLLLGLMGDGLGFDSRKVGLSHVALPISHDFGNFWYVFIFV